jgi:NAD(P)-dependent dehydrogenase (short-subunit alcohol dehydrogenase family)
VSGRFAGRRALVTGASRGIGAGIAERLAAEGADVVLTARTLERHDHLAGSLRETAGRLARYGGRVDVLVADLASPEDVAGLVPAAVDRLGGPIDILVNNAAAAIYQPLADFPLRRRLLTFQVNVHAPVELIQAVLPAMRAAGRGWIVNVSSASARLTAEPSVDLPPPGPAIGVYAASKAALNRLSNLMAAELSGSGICINTIEPRSAVLSEGAAALLGGELDPDGVESLEEMVEAVAALCDCPEDVTGRIAVSLDLLREWELTVRGLDAQPWDRQEVHA